MPPVLGLALAIFLAVISPCWAGEQKLYRIGGLCAEDQFIPVLEGFKWRMAELGYSEGKNIIYDLRNAKGDQDILKRLAEILVQKGS